jgi:hypothetical protein
MIMKLTRMSVTEQPLDSRRSRTTDFGITGFDHHHTLSTKFIRLLQSIGWFIPSLTANPYTANQRLSPKIVNFDTVDSSLASCIAWVEIAAMVFCAAFAALVWCTGHAVEVEGADEVVCSGNGVKQLFADPLQPLKTLNRVRL